MAGSAKKKHELTVQKATNQVTATKIRTTKTTRVKLEECSQKKINLYPRC
jgi:hypothetical protein